MNNILVVEDDSRVADLLRRALEEEGYNVSVAYDGSSALRAFRSLSFDLVISDVMLPEIDGIALCKRLKEQQPSILIIILTALGTTDDKLEGFDAGADDYMTKPFDVRELNARVRALLKRTDTKKDTEQANIIQYDDLVLDTSLRTAKRGDIEIHLSPKEYSLLLYMIKNSERVISRVEIAESVWATHFDTGTNFIDVYINYLRKKVDKGFNHPLIHTKPGIGFYLAKLH